MDYKKIYDDLVSKAKQRGLDRDSVDFYTEIHHITPRCMGGSNDEDNLVMLSGREHYIAHMLLWKAYPDNGPLKYAAMMMSNRAICKVNSKVYSALKEEFSEAVSVKRRGKCHRDLMGQRFTRLLVVDMDDCYIAPSGSRQAKWICQCDCGNTVSVVSGSLTTKNTQSCGCLQIERGRELTGENNPFFGRKHTEETKEKFKNRPIRTGEDNPRFGVKLSEEMRLKMSQARKGIPWSESRRANATFKYGEDHHFYGKTHSEEVRKIISEKLRARKVRPWQNLSTATDESLTKWAMCDNYYELWLYFDKPGLKKFTKIYNTLYDDNVSLAFFTHPRLHWLGGWVPNEDEEWLTFKDQFLEGTWQLQ